MLGRRSVRRPSPTAGLLAAVALVAACTAAVYPLKQITAVASLGVVYLLGVVVVSAFWGLWLGLLTSLLSAAAFNFFHLPPVGHFTIADGRNWVALAAFFVAAVATSTVSERARMRDAGGRAPPGRGRPDRRDGPAAARAHRGPGRAGPDRPAPGGPVRAPVGLDRADRGGARRAPPGASRSWPAGDGSARCSFRPICPRGSPSACASASCPPCRRCSGWSWTASG